VHFDVGNVLQYGHPDQWIRILGRRILDVHLKDVTAATKEGVPIEAGRGVIDLPRFLRALAEMDYRGTAAFEYEKDGRDPLPGLAESLGYVRGILAAWAGPDGRPERDHLEK
jgi:sugar phosphate isomerase/epimerase